MLLSLLSILMPHAELSCDEVETNSLYEIALTSSFGYENPHDVRVTCRFVGPGLAENVDGYWNGGSSYNIRFSPPEPGVWRYITSCSDTANRGLHAIAGTFTVIPSTKTDAFSRHGWPRISDNGRYLVHHDNEPFFYLGDTAWEITWKSTADEVRRYIADRKAKGFNVIQVVAMSHQQVHDFGVRNRYGVDYFLNKNFDLPNPRYFDYLDTVVNIANENGISVTLVPLWSAFCYLYFPSGHPYSFNRGQCMRIARYIGARYAGSNVMWIVGGDNLYETLERKQFWSEFARTLRDASGWRHATTLHPHGWGTSYQYFDNNTEWLDFNMYQSSHIPNVSFTYDAGLQGYALAPLKPVINGEAVYEDIPAKMWAPGDTSDPTADRNTAADVRQASYESVLSGAIAGMVYGANGIWQWHYKEDDEATHSPRYLVEVAESFPGSSQLGVLKRLLTQFRWWTFEPGQDLVLETDMKTFLPLSKSDTRIVAYFKRHLSYARIDISHFGRRARLRWIDPITGQDRYRREEGDLDGTLTVTPPDTNDWLLVIESPMLSSVPVYTGTGLDIIGVFPNPARGSSALWFSTIAEGTAQLDVYDVTGRHVYDYEGVYDDGSWSLPVPGLMPGTYIVSLRFTTFTGSTSVKFDKMVSTGE